MNLYKLRHFSMFLFQAYNESNPQIQQAFASGRTTFPRDLTAIEHWSGVSLIMRAFDRKFYTRDIGYSVGMYMNMLREEQD